MAFRIFNPIFAIIISLLLINGWEELSFANLANLSSFRRGRGKSDAWSRLVFFFRFQPAGGQAAGAPG